MTVRERFMAVMQKEHFDQIPWVARMVLWYHYHQKMGTLPHQYQDWSLYDIHRHLGVGILGRCPLLKEEMIDVEVVVWEEGEKVFTEYRTPFGKVRTMDVLSPQLKRWGAESALRKEYMIKDLKDYKVVEYIVEHTRLVPNYEEFLAYDQEIGQDGVTLGRIGKSPFQRVLIEIMGYEKTYYEIEDHPKKFEHLLKVLYDLYRKIGDMAIESPADLIWSNDNFHGMMTSPSLFERYCAPYFKELSAKCHAKDKFLATHGDGDIKSLIKPLGSCGIDIAEAFTPWPMTSCTIKEAREEWKGRVTIWGGIPSAILCPGMNAGEFERYVVSIFKEAAPGDSFILGIGDNIVPEASIERVAKVTELVNKYGKYPLNF